MKRMTVNVTSMAVRWSVEEYVIAYFVTFEIIFEDDMCGIKLMLTNPAITKATTNRTIDVTAFLIAIPNNSPSINTSAMVIYGAIGSNDAGYNIIIMSELLYLNFYVYRPAKISVIQKTG